MKHSEKITLAKKMAKRTLPKGASIFQSPAWENRKMGRQVKLMNSAMRRASKKSSIPADILKFIATQK